MSIISYPPKSDALSVVSPLLGNRWLRILLVAAPGVTAAAGILTAMASNLALVVLLNLATGVIISSVLFVAIGVFTRRAAEERMELSRATEQEIWRARAMRFSIHNEATGLYADWYFRLRLQEEVERSKRYGVRFSLLIVRPIGLHVDAELTSAAGWFADHIQRHLRRSDLPALLQDGSIGIIMPNTARRAASIVQERVNIELAAVRPRSGVACYPDDANAIPQLFIIAMERSEQPPEAQRVAERLAAHSSAKAAPADDEPAPAEQEPAVASGAESPPKDGTPEDASGDAGPDSLEENGAGPQLVSTVAGPEPTTRPEPENTGELVHASTAARSPKGRTRRRRAAKPPASPDAPS